MNSDVRYFPNIEALSKSAASIICDLANNGVKMRGIFTIALSGGNSPRELYTYLSQQPLSGEIPWSFVHFFWVDERCLPVHSPHSNFRMAHDLLLSRIPVPEKNIHRMPGEIKSPGQGARLYEEEMKKFFRTQSWVDPNVSFLSREKGFPVFDLIVLGIGKDGHVASLFPGDTTVNEKEKWVAAVSSPPALPPVDRLTLTFPVINKAKLVMVIASGKGKEEIIESVLSPHEPSEKPLPAEMVRPGGRLIWLVNQHGWTKCSVANPRE